MNLTLGYWAHLILFVGSTGDLPVKVVESQYRMTMGIVQMGE